MADVQENTNSVVSWIALLIGALALPIAVVAYNRSGEDISTTVEKKTADVVDEAQDTTAQVGSKMADVGNDIAQNAAEMRTRAELEARLIQIQSEVNANNVTDNTVKEVQDLRTDLRNTYANASDEAKEQVDEMDSDLAELEMQVRQDTAAALANISSLLERLRQDVMSTDDDGMNDQGN